MIDCFKDIFAARLLRNTKSHQEIKAVAKISGDDYNVVVKTYSFVRFSFLCRSKNPEKLMFFEVFKEAQTGFEPVDTGVADHCLTTWLRRHMTPTGIEPVLPP